MPTYGLLQMDKDGRLIERRQIECANDADAIAAARAYLSTDGQVAIFQDTRRVETLGVAPRLESAAD